MVELDIEVDMLDRRDKRTLDKGLLKTEIFGSSGYLSLVFFHFEVSDLPLQLTVSFLSRR